MSRPRWLRPGLKIVHEVASIGLGGGFAACLVVNLAASHATAAAFIDARTVIAAVARYVLLPSLTASLISGLIAIAATRGFHDAGWAWAKALLGLSLFEATLVTIGAARDQAELAAVAADPRLMAAMLQSERSTLWLLIVLTVVNVVLAVWRPKLMITIR